MKPMPLYISGASIEHARVRKWADALEKSKLIQITHRWFEGAEKWAGRDRKHTSAARLQLSLDELGAIRKSSLFWLLLPAQLAGGSMIEFGFALGRLEAPLRVVASGAGLKHTIFTTLAHEQHDLDVHAFQSILRHATRRTAGA